MEISHVGHSGPHSGPPPASFLAAVPPAPPPPVRISVRVSAEPSPGEHAVYAVHCALLRAAPACGAGGGSVVTPVTWKVVHRFSDFDALRNELADSDDEGAAGAVAAAAHLFPPKHPLSASKAPEVVAARAAALPLWLTAVAAAASDEPVFRAFLGLDLMAAALEEADGALPADAERLELTAAAASSQPPLQQPPPQQQPPQQPPLQRPKPARRLKIGRSVV